MGNEPSKEMSPEKRTEIARRFHADIDARAAEVKAKRLSEIRALKAAKAEHVREAAAAAAAAEREKAEHEEGEVADEDEVPVTVKPKLVRSSKGDAVPRAPQSAREISIANDDMMDVDFADPTPILSARAGPLNTWEPRKQKVADASPTAQASVAGFEHQITRPPSAADTLPSTRQEPTVPQGGRKKRDADLAEAASSDGPASPEGSKQLLTTSDRSKAATDFFKGGATKKPTPPPIIDTDLEKQSAALKSASNASSAKRTTADAFVDERRTSTQKAPKRSAAASPQSPQEDATPRGSGSGLSGISRIPKKPGSSKQAESASTPEATTAIEERPPAWYTKLTQTNKRNPDEANVSATINRLKADITRCQSLSSPKAQQAFDAIRESLHALAFEKVSGQLLRDTRTLHNAYGLPQIFDSTHAKGVSFPWDIKADAEELYNKYCRRVFETDLLRGIIRGKPKKPTGADDSSADSFDPKYEGRVSARFHGNGLLLNGQWWPTQLAAVRDGAHGATIAGISGTAGEGGACSCIMSGEHKYPDKDNRTWVLYCGTDSETGAVTDKTQLLLESERSGKPVRLIRSHKLQSKYAPEIGFRYDGLYKVVSHEELDGAESLRRRHRFRMERLPQQPPLRGTGPEKRPTAQEVDAHKLDKKRRGFK